MRNLMPHAAPGSTQKTWPNPPSARWNRFAKPLVAVLSSWAGSWTGPLWASGLGEPHGEGLSVRGRTRCDVGEASRDTFLDTSRDTFFECSRDPKKMTFAASSQSASSLAADALDTRSAALVIVIGGAAAESAKAESAKAEAEKAVGWSTDVDVETDANEDPAGSSAMRVCAITDWAVSASSGSRPAGKSC